MSETNTQDVPLEIRQHPWWQDFRTRNDARIADLERELERFKHLWSVARTRTDTAEGELEAAHLEITLLSDGPSVDEWQGWLNEAKRELEAEREARQRAETERDMYKLTHEVTAPSLRERAQQVEGEWQDWKKLHDTDQQTIRELQTRLADAEGLLREAKAHIDELEDAWQRGVISEHDGKGGTRSNRNVEIRAALSAFLARIGTSGEEMK